MKVKYKVLYIRVNLDKQSIVKFQDSKLATNVAQHFPPNRVEPTNLFSQFATLNSLVEKEAIKQIKKLHPKKSAVD